MLLKEFHERGYDLEKLKSYEEFLIECSEKDYSSYAIHSHHILPEFMEGTDNVQNLINLSPEDHFRAHMILGECFDVGSDNRRYNFGSGNLIFKNAKRCLKKVFGNDIPIEISQFWECANLHMKDILKGEGNPMYGKSHTDEARLKISKVQKGLGRSEEWRKNHSEKVSGEKNGMYGTNRIISADTKRRISDSLKITFKDKFKLKNGVFENENYISEDVTSKRYYRLCPNLDCSNIVYYSSRWQANQSAENNTFCRICTNRHSASKTRGKKFEDTTPWKKPKSNTEKMGKYDKSGHNNPRAISVVNPNTGEIWKCMKHLQEHLGVSYDILRRMIRSGEYKILGDSNGSC